MNDEKNTPLLSFYSDEDKLYAYVSGEIDHHSASALRQSADDLIYKYRPSNLIFDLSDIEFMDSSGLGFIMGRYALVQKLGGRATILNPGKRVEKIISLAGLERIIKIERTKTK